jgi:hypothetical protein
MDPLLSHAISKFKLMFIPDMLLKNIPPFISSLVISILPVTPINLIIFILIFAFVYSSNIFNMSHANSYECRNKTLVKKHHFSLWATLKNAYYFYFIIAYIVNLLSLVDYQMLNLNAVKAMT